MMETLFSISSLLVMPFWILMLFAPRWKGTQRVMASPWIVAAPAVLYAALLVPRVGEVGPAVLRPTLEDIARLLGTPEGATLAWLHFLAFDLFVGRWIYLDSRVRELSVWLMAPILFLTLMFGPIGLLSYLAARSLPTGKDHQKYGGEGEKPEQGGSGLGKKARDIYFSLAETDRFLAMTSLAYLGLLPFVVAGIGLDPRRVTDAPAWLKPAKFLLSISIYNFTLLWMLRFVQGHRRMVRGAAQVTALALLAEMLIIGVQAGRGTTSHFNVGTPLDAALWSAMGLFIVLAWAANLVTAILLWRSRMANSTLAWSLRFGVALTFVGMGIGFFMTSPTPEQLAQGRATGLQIAGAHTVGAPDGGPGLPVTRWSTRGGDLRVPHFVGIHALQILPLLGGLLSRRPHRSKERHHVALVWTAGVTYFGIIGLLTWQALRGQPLIAPDALTLSAFGALLTAAALVTAGILLHARHSARRLLPSRV